MTLYNPLNTSRTQGTRPVLLRIAKILKNECFSEKQVLLIFSKIYDLFSPPLKKAEIERLCSIIFSNNSKTGV